MKRIALGAGHYMGTPGKRVPQSLDPAETREWWLNDRVCDYVELGLSRYRGYELLRTDDSDDGADNISLSRRAEAANAWEPDIYISVHHNAAGKVFSGGGIVAFVHPKASAASFEWRDELYAELIEETGLRGNRSTPLATANFQILREVKAPAVLLELGFMDSTSDLPQIMTDDYARKCADAIVRVLVRRLGLTEKKERTMTYKTINGIRIAEVPASQLRVILYDDRKKSMGRNRCNAGFFSTPSENNVKFTLPVGHLACDYEAAEKWTRHYCEERGTFVGDKYRFDSGSWAFMNPTHGRAVSTLLLSRGKARIADVVDLPRDCDYAISGVPVMRSGGDVKFKTYVKGQGWNGQELRATWHVFVGLKQAESDTVFVMAMRTLTSNLVYSAEAFKKFKALGFYDVIKLDGGGSFYFNAGGSSVSTAENRRVCSILDFGPAGGNPYPEPTRALKKGASGNSVKWLQWELNRHGFVCDLDGSFGPNTDRLLREYQRSVGLTADGSCGPATRAQLLK